MADDRSPKGNRYAELLRQAPVSVLNETFSTDIFQRWKLATDDPNVRDVANELDALWGSWDDKQRDMLLLAAERIAQAHAARLAWEPDADEKRRFADLIRRLVTAAQLARDLSALVPPPPWKDEDAVLRNLIVSLATFATTSLGAVTLRFHGFAALMAKEALRGVKKKTPKHPRASRELIAKLAWLAGGQRRDQPVNEAMVRRYENTPVRLPPAAKSVNNAWTVLQLASRLAAQPLAAVPEHPIAEQFRQVLEDFLRGSRIQ